MRNEYVSPSTIDNPPPDFDDDEEKQLDLFETDDDLAALDAEPHERKWKVSLKLTLTADDGKPTSVSLAAGMWRGNILMELLQRSVSSRRNRKIIEAVLDNPERITH